MVGLQLLRYLMAFDSDRDSENRPLLSSKSIPRQERLIVALDVNSPKDAIAAVQLLGESVSFYKIGLQLLMSGRYFELLDELVELNKKVFIDLKLYDVPETVGLAVSQLTHTRATFVTVHGYQEILRSATAAKQGLKVLAVTVLTSLDRDDIRQLGYPVEVAELVKFRAKNAMEMGCDGVIASAVEARPLREALGEEAIIVTPGIRPADYGRQDDQKRTMDARHAFLNGADYIVVGRPILKAENPREKAEQMQAVITELFPS
jgi:orotidine-5'-phosphate decarboxylase